MMLPSRTMSRPRAPEDRVEGLIPWHLDEAHGDLPCTSSVVMTLRPLTSARMRSTFWMSASLKSSEMRCPMYSRGPEGGIASRVPPGMEATPEPTPEPSLFLLPRELRLELCAAMTADSSSPMASVGSARAGSAASVGLGGQLGRWRGRRYLRDGRRFRLLRRRRRSFQRPRASQEAEEQDTNHLLHRRSQTLLLHPHGDRLLRKLHHDLLRLHVAVEVAGAFLDDYASRFDAPHYPAARPDGRSGGDDVA